MSAILAMLIGASGFKVTVSGGSALGAASATVELTSSGTVLAQQDGTPTQLSAATDWIIPNSEASGNFEVRFTQNSGDAPTAGTLNTWQSLSSTRGIGYVAETAAKSGNFTIEVRVAGGTVLASGDYDIAVTG